MFTGLIEEIGTVKSVQSIGSGRKITVQAEKVLDDLKIDDSIALNGACQTVIARTDKTFEVVAVEETLRKTTLGKFNSGKRINLERAAKVGDRIGGHLVQGHIDCTGNILSIQPETAGKLIWVGFPKEFRKYIVKIGSICINGVSLTVANLEGAKFMTAIIPHTWDMTTFNELRIGDEVNLEFDIIGKYIENMVEPFQTNKKSILEDLIDQPD